MSFTDDELNRLFDSVPRLDDHRDRLADLERIRDEHEAARTNDARSLSPNSPWTATAVGPVLAPSVSIHDRNRRKQRLLEQLADALDEVVSAWSNLREARSEILTDEPWDKPLDVLPEIRSLSLGYVDRPSERDAVRRTGAGEHGSARSSGPSHKVEFPLEEQDVEDLAQVVRRRAEEFKLRGTRHGGGANRGGRSTSKAVDRHFVRQVCQCVGLLGPVPADEWLPTMAGVVRVVLPTIGRDRRKALLESLEDELGSTSLPASSS